MLSWKSGCNLVASIASFICIISKSGSSQVRKDSSRTRVHRVAQILSQEMPGSFRAVKKAIDTEFAGDDSIILISVCVSASLVN